MLRAKRILDCFGSGAEALYAKALAANDAGTLFPGGKNTNIDVSIDSTIEDVPEDAPENQNPMQQISSQLRVLA